MQQIKDGEKNTARIKAKKRKRIKNKAKTMEMINKTKKVLF